MRFDDTLINKLGVDKQISSDQIMESPIKKLFENQDLMGTPALMLSYEFSNLIRDDQNIYCFLDSPHQSFHSNRS